MDMTVMNQLGSEAYLGKTPLNSIGREAVKNKFNHPLHVMFIIKMISRGYATRAKLLASKEKISIKKQIYSII